MRFHLSVGECIYFKKSQQPKTVGGECRNERPHTHKTSQHRYLQTRPLALKLPVLKKPAGLFRAHAYEAGQKNSLDVKS